MNYQGELCKKPKTRRSAGRWQCLSVTFMADDTIRAMKTRSRIVWAVVWAVVIIVAAFVFKGNPAKDWIEVGLIGLAVVFVVLIGRR